MKPTLREYGDLDRHEMSQGILLASCEGWSLSNHSEGYEPAGSVARYTPERWRVTRYDARSNTTYGRSFLTHQAAAAYFDERVALVRQA